MEKTESGINLNNLQTHYNENGKNIDKQVYDKVKRTLDIVLSLILIIPIGLIVMVAAIVVKIESKGPVIFKQVRAGKDHKPFTIYKIRTMVHSPIDCERNLTWAQKDDPRITKVGLIMRKFRIDELPQIVNVLKGDMSFVGPRPETVELTNKFIQEVNGFEERLNVKPGLTGLAQVNGGYELSPCEKLVYDRIYISTICLWTDIKILWATIKVVIIGEGAR